MPQPFTPDKDANRDESYKNAIKNQSDLLWASSDNFNKLIADSTRNEADIAGHYPYSPERWRLFKNGARQFVQYGSVTGFSDDVSGFTISPAGGEAWTFETAERFRYKVGYVVEPSFAFRLNQSLTGNDFVVVGYGDPFINNLASDSTDLTTVNADGYFMEMDSTLADDEVRLAMYRAGTRLNSKVVELNTALTVISRFGLRLNWYGVGSCVMEETYTENGRQFNARLAEIGNDDGKASETANKNAVYGIRPDTGTSNLELEVGSTAFRTLGDVQGIIRQKVHYLELSVDQTGAWIPVHAIRKDPAREDVVSMQLLDIVVKEYTGNSDIRILVTNHAKENVADSGGNALVDGDFSTPPELSSTNSVLEDTDNVDQAADSTGTVVASTSNPGGYQLGMGTLFTGGGGDAVKRQDNAQVTQKREITDGDYAVFWAFAPDATGTVRILTAHEEEW